MSRSSKPRRSGTPTLLLVALPLILVALAAGFAMTRPRAAATMPPPGQAAVPHFTVVLMPFEQYEAQL